MIKTSRTRRALAAVVGLVLAGSVSAAAAVPASASDVTDVVEGRLLSSEDFNHSGWVDTSAFTDVTADGLLAQCQIELPYWSKGFRSLEKRGFQQGAESRFGTELVMKFRSAHDAKAYLAEYTFGVDTACPKIYGAKRWDVRSSKDLHLAHRSEHAHTWAVRDRTGVSQSISVSTVRVGKRVALVWTVGFRGDDPSVSLDVLFLVQQAADRIRS